jgi:hypothetical protein
VLQPNRVTGRDSSVSIVTRLLAGRYGVRMTVWLGNLYFVENIQRGSMAHAAASLMDVKWP